MQFIFIVLAALLAVTANASTRYIPQQQSMKHHELFLDRIHENLERPGVNNVISRLSDIELADLVLLYGAASNGNQHQLVTVLSNRIDNAQMTRLSSAFNRPTTLTQSVPKGTIINGSPTLDMTLTEVYLEYRTAPVGSLGVGAAMAETAMYTAGWLSASWAAGYSAGTGASMLMQRYMPNTWESIGNAIGGFVNAFNHTSDMLTRGSYQQQIDRSFGGTISVYGTTHSNYNSTYGSSSPDYSGDFNTSSAFDYRMDANYFNGGQPSCRIRHCSQF